MKSLFAMGITIMGLISLLMITSVWGEVYNYKGYAELPLQQALEITSEYSENAEIVSNSPADKVYVTYDFRSDKPSIYTIDGKMDYVLFYVRWVMLSLSLVLTIGGIVGIIVNRKEAW